MLVYQRVISTYGDYGDHYSLYIRQEESHLRPPKDLGNGTNNLGIGTRDQITLELSHWWMLGKAGQD